MATTILGKRSRVSIDSEAVAPTLPPRKRQTRTSAVPIFEDACNNDVTCTTPKQSRSSRKNSSSQRKAVVVKAQKCPIQKDEVFPDPGEAQIQDENTVPANVLLKTPSTQRFKDVLNNTPSTPKHQVRSSPGLFTPQTPRYTDALKTRSQTIYSSARQLFTQSATPQKLVGRETERETIRNFISDSRTTNKGGCLYISGPPGTGKSAMVQDVLQEYENQPGLGLSVINCVSLRTAPEVYTKLMEDIMPSNTGKASSKSQLQKCFTTQSEERVKVVMLDEIDSLIEGDCEILYTLFEWALHASSSLALIGVANALDLTDRFLPRLKTRGLKPRILPFLPYTGQQIADIVTQKLQTLLPTNTANAAFVPVMHPTAIQLCGKKIASQSGDLRKAFALVRRSIDMIEKEATTKQSQHQLSRQPLGENSNVAASAPTVTQMDYSAETAPRVSIAQIARLASSIFNNGTASRLGGLNLQQKAVLCSLIASERRKQERNPFITPSKSSSKALTIRDLFVKYTALCRRDEGVLQPLKDSEFRDVVSSLETLGLVHESKARSSSLLTPTSSTSRGARNNDDRPIGCGVSEKEMRNSLSGAGTDLLQRLLDE